MPCPPGPVGEGFHRWPPTLPVLLPAAILESAANWYWCLMTGDRRCPFIRTAKNISFALAILEHPQTAVITLVSSDRRLLASTGAISTPYIPVARASVAAASVRRLQSPCTPYVRDRSSPAHCILPASRGPVFALWCVRMPTPRHLNSFSRMLAPLMIKSTVLLFFSVVVHLIREALG